MRVAVVDVVLTAAALEALATDAGVSVASVDAGGEVEAGVGAAGGTLSQLADCALPVGGAVAEEGGAQVATRAAVQAGGAVAVGVCQVTSLPLAVARAVAGVVGHGVHAGAVVAARIRLAFVLICGGRRGLVRTGSWHGKFGNRW